jgi:hypothetical protein
MNPVIGWTLAVIFVALAWQQYGWQGALFAATAVVFWLLLQFNRAIRAMKNASNRPVGRVDSAVMLHAKLKPGMTLMQVLSLTRSLGRKVGDHPERFEWVDASDSSVVVTVQRGRCVSWTLKRPDDAVAAEAPPAA